MTITALTHYPACPVLNRLDTMLTPISQKHIIPTDALTARPSSALHAQGSRLTPRPPDAAGHNSSPASVDAVETRHTALADPENEQGTATVHTPVLAAPPHCALLRLARRRGTAPVLLVPAPEFEHAPVPVEPDEQPKLPDAIDSTRPMPLYAAPRHPYPLLNPLRPHLSAELADALSWQGCLASSGALSGV